MLHVEPSVVALLGAGLLVLISGARSHHYLASVEWETLLFSAGLFIMIGALVRKGVVITAITVAVAAPYLWLRYFVLA